MTRAWAARASCDQGATLGEAGVGVVHHDVAALGQGLGDQLALAVGGAAVIVQQVLADQLVGLGEALAVEGALSGAGEAHQDHQLGHRAILTVPWSRLPFAGPRPRARGPCRRAPSTGA